MVTDAGDALRYPGRLLLATRCLVALAEADALPAETVHALGQAETATLVNHPLRYDGEVPPLRCLALRLGEDTRAVLSELGYGAAEIDELIARKVVAAPGEEKTG